MSAIGVAARLDAARSQKQMSLWTASFIEADPFTEGYFGLPEQFAHALIIGDAADRFTEQYR